MADGGAGALLRDGRNTQDRRARLSEALMKLSVLSNHAASIRIEAKEAASLLQGLEAQRSELGVVAEELILLLRQAGISADDQKQSSGAK